MLSKFSLVVFAIVLPIGFTILAVGCAHPELETELIYKADLSAYIGSEEQVMTDALRLITERLDAFGVEGARVERSGTDQIVVQLPKIEDLDTAIELIASTAQLDFRELVYDSSGNPVPDENGNIVWKPATGILNGEEVQLTGRYLERNMQVVFDQTTAEPEVAFEFNSEGAKLFEQITTRLLERPLGIFLDDQLITSPIVKVVLSDKAVITGLTLDEARNLAILLNSGALPFPLTLVSRRPLTS